MKKIIELTDEIFENTIQNGLILVDFWAPWCGPCRMLTPLLEELATESGNNVIIAKVNVDDNPKTALKYQVVSIPTVLLFKNGEKVEATIGVNKKEFYENLISRNL